LQASAGSDIWQIKTMASNPDMLGYRHAPATKRQGRRRLDRLVGGALWRGSALELEGAFVQRSGHDDQLIRRGGILVTDAAGQAKALLRLLPKISRELRLDRG